MTAHAGIMIVSSVAVLILCFKIRIHTLLKAPHAGCDAYYFLLTREVFLKNKRLPIVLPPYYALEYQQQWYPPGFTVFLSLIPKKVVDKYYWCISPAVDSLLCAGVFIFTAMFTGSLPAAAVAAAFYITSHAAIRETATLTSRQMGAFLATGCFFSGALYVAHGNPYMLAASVIFGVLVLMTHKFSTQTLYIALPAMALLNLEPKFLFVLGAVIGCALAASLGFYVKIFLSHIDYITFWSKRWAFLGAHYVNDSPVYSEVIAGENFVYKKGWEHAKLFIREFAWENTYFTVALVMLVEYLVEPGMARETLYAAQYTLIVLGIGFFVHLIPALRGIGLGGQYGKLALPVGAFCVGCAFLHPPIGYFAVCALVLTLERKRPYWIDTYIKAGKSQEKNMAGSGWDLDGMEKMFEFLASLEKPLLFCLPTNYYDLIVYHCKIRVLWGGHGSPVKRLDSQCPVLKESVENICEKHGVTHILVDADYAPPERVGIKGSPCREFGKIKIFKYSRDLFDENKK